MMTDKEKTRPSGAEEPEQGRGSRPLTRFDLEDVRRRVARWQTTAYDTERCVEEIDRLRMLAVQQERVSRVTRDERGNVLCSHGRPFSCGECGEDYAMELDGPAGETCGTLIAGKSHVETGKCSTESPGAYFERLLVEMKGMSLAWMLEAMETYAEWNGPCHDDDCPCDDTCNCSQKWVNDGVNSTCRLLKALAKQSERL